MKPRLRWRIWSNASIKRISLYHLVFWLGIEQLYHSYPQVYPHIEIVYRDICPYIEIINLTDNIFIFYGWRKREGSGGWSTISRAFVIPKPQYIDISKFSWIIPHIKLFVKYLYIPQYGQIYLIY